MLSFAEGKFGEQIDVAWEDFNMSDRPVPFDAYPDEQQIFMPYFLFHWDPHWPRSGRGAGRRGGIVTRWYELEKAGELSEMERLLLEQATTQPLTFFEVLCSEAGERIRLREILVGGETEVVERSASRTLQTGDIIYGQIWDLQRFSILGCTAPIRIRQAGKAKWSVFERSCERKLPGKIAK